MIKPYGGNLGKDPELKQGKTSYCLFSIAEQSGWGENKKTSWYNCISFGKQAEMISKYFSKGDKMIFDAEQTVEQKDGKTFVNVTVKNVYLELCQTKGKQQAKSVPENDYNENEPKDDMPF